MNIIHEYRSADILAYEDRLLEEKVKDIKVDRILRIIFSFLICAGVFFYIYHVINIVYKQGEMNLFLLDGSVMITLLTTTTANVIGLMVIVAKYLFPKNQ